MANEDGIEDRLTKTEFAELIQHLSMQEIVSIEYRIGKNWRKLFNRKSGLNAPFICNLCTLETSSFKNLLAHIDGRKHKLQMDRVQQLYHPDYTHPKEDKNESAEKSEVVAKTNSNKKTITSTNTVQNTVKAPAVVSGLNNNSKNLLVTPTVVDGKNKREQIKSLDVADDSIRKKNDSGKNVEQERNEKNKANICQEKQSLKSASSGNQNIQTKQNTDDCGKSTMNENPTLDSSKKNVTKQTIQATSLVKNPFALKTQETQNIEGSKNNDSQELTKENEKINKDVCAKSPQNNSTVVGKRANTNTSDNTATVGNTEAKKAKVVLNPAAAFSGKTRTNNEQSKRNSQDTTDEEKPQYQTDKILIPTKHKPSKTNKETQQLPSQATATSSMQDNKDLPKFSVKTYSSKPSDNDVQGILGVEYVIKILKSRSDTSPRYECGLCELVLDGFAMQRHLEGYNHRLKFCEKHFPTAIRHYRQYMHNLPEHEFFKVMTPVLTKLATAIEQHHGRNLPYECYDRDYSLNRHEILAKAFSCRHASEQYGPTFTHVVGAKEIDDYINERHKYIAPTTSRFASFDSKAGNIRSDSRHSSKDSVTRDRHRHSGRGEFSTATSSSQHGESSHKSYMSSIVYNDLYPSSNVYPQTVSQPVVNQVDDETYKLMVEDFLKGTLKGISSVRSRDHRKRSASPAHSSTAAKRKSLSPLRQDDIWQAYRHMVDQELNNLDERFKEYRKDPETHPSYNDEWQKFWKRRKDELISAGLDHRKYNYQPEWVRFIKVRIEELYSQDVENLKIKSRERLCLPMTNHNLNEDKYHVQAPKMNSPDVVLITNDPNDVAAANSTNSLANALSVNAGTTPQVVSVLRLMTALEENLGSLGPKIIDLLSKALQAEKSNPTQVNATILNNENCTIIETAKEKLKGLVLAGLFEGSKNRVLKKVVNETESLLSYAQQFRNVRPVKSDASLSSSANASAVNNVLNTLKNQAPSTQSTGGHQTSSSLSIGTLLTQVDKKELASKLAASLVAQGKTDFDPQQLQQLIAVYTLIEKKKRTAITNKGNSMTAASSSKKNLSDMLSDLLKPSSSATSSIQDINNSLVSKQPNLNTTDESSYRMSLQGTGVGISSRASGSNQGNFNNAVVGGGYPSDSSFTSVSQNSGANYFSNTTQSTDNAIGVSGGTGGHVSYGFNYSNNLFPPYQQQNSNPNEMYNPNQYQNNGNMAQNWNWNSNMGPNQNYNMSGSSNPNQSSSNWRNF